MKMEKYALLDTDFISKTHFIQGNTEKSLSDLVVEMPGYCFFCHSQIHYLGQYLSTKSTYNEFLKARFKGKFRKDHADEIEKHEKAAQILKAQNPDGSLPKMKDFLLADFVL